MTGGTPGIVGIHGLGCQREFPRSRDTVAVAQRDQPERVVRRHEHGITGTIVLKL